MDIAYILLDVCFSCNMLGSTLSDIYGRNISISYIVLKRGEILPSDHNNKESK